MLPSGIRPDLTLEEREVKRQLGKCHPRAYSDLIRSDIPGSSGVSPSYSLYSRSPPPLAMETSPEGPPVVKPTREELQAHVELLRKKRRSAKPKAQAPPESSLPTRGKISKLGASAPPSPAKEWGPRTQVRVRRQALPSLAEVSEVAGAQRHSSFATRDKGSSRRATEPPLKVLPISIWSPSAQNATPSPLMRGDAGSDRFGVEGGEDSLLTNEKLATGTVLSILRDSNLKKVDALCVEEALALSLQGTISVCPSAFFYSSHRCVNDVCYLHLVLWQTTTYTKSLARKASLTENSIKAAKAYKAKVASLTSERAELLAWI